MESGAAFVAKTSNHVFMLMMISMMCYCLKHTDDESEKLVRLSLDNIVKKGERFDTKRILKSRMEMCAMKHNFDYKVFKSNNTWWNIRRSDNVCNWRLRATCVPGYKVFKITKYVSQHTCALSRKKNGRKTASAKTIVQLIMTKYQGVKEEPSLIDVVQCMLLKEGVNISYYLAFDARDYAFKQEKSYDKIPKYLYMLKAANPGTHYNLETVDDGRFKYMFLAFGQSIRGFHKTMRRVCY